MSAPMSHQARDLAAHRAQAPHTSMFVRMLLRAAVLRRGRAASALFAMVVAAAVATAMLNLYVDVQAKLQREFRNTARISFWLERTAHLFLQVRFRRWILR